jgi:hypothetical protein
MTSQPPKRRKGCLFYGCLTLTACFLIFLVLLLAALYQFRRVVYQYTDSSPMPLPTLNMTAEQMDAVQRRVDAFKDALNAGRSTPPLVLTADDINALINTDPEFKPFKGRLYVTALEDGKGKLAGSVRLGDIGFIVFRSRYLNGTATIGVTFQNGILGITPEELTTKGKPLPGPVMDKIHNLQISSRINQDPHASVALNRLQSIEIRDGKLILVPKQQH